MKTERLEATLNKIKSIYNEAVELIFLYSFRYVIKHNPVMIDHLFKDMELPTEFLYKMGLLQPQEPDKAQKEVSMEPVDRKFKILAANPCKQGSIYTEQDGFFFCAKDQFAIPALDAYISAMEESGKVEESQIKSALLLRDRVIAYQRINGFKIPDIAEGCEAEFCLKPNQEA